MELDAVHRLIAVSMPLGVEHTEYDRYLFAKGLLIAVSMPLGVEHKTRPGDKWENPASDRRLDASGR